MLLTILTPTYNRAFVINNLYKSLLKQTCKDFMWLVIDDGSTDNTEKIINKYKAENIINIKYIKKNNGGKHSAINVAMDHLTSYLTIIVDSDDLLTDDAVKIISDYYKKYKDFNIGFFSFLRINSKNEIICKTEKNEFIDNYLNIRIKRNLKGDMAEVFLTDVLKKYRFIEFNNEKFISEDTLWIEIAKKYDTLFINKAIYVCDYLCDGITLNDKKNKFQSPLGSMYRGKQLMNKQCGLLINIKGGIIYNCYKLEINEVCDLLKPSNLYEKLLIILTKPIGYLYNFKWKKEAI